MEPLKRLGRELVYKGAIIDLYKDTVQDQDGRIQEYDFIGHKGAAAVVPVTDEGKILMVRQYRNALDRFTLEIPAGGLNGKDEPGIVCTARELEEETGLTGVYLEQIYTMSQPDRDPRMRVIVIASAASSPATASASSP